MKSLTFDPIRDRFNISLLPLPQIANNEVLIHVDACGLNPVDAKIAEWKSSIPKMDDTWVPGLDISGVIAKVGSDVNYWQVGDRVLCHGDMLSPYGGFAEYTVQNAEALVPHPNLSSEIAAATPYAGWTAWFALEHLLKVHEYASILITDDRGGVGAFATQIAAYFGLHKIVVISSPENHEYIRSLGASEIIDGSSENVHSKVMEITHNEGVAVVFNTLGQTEHKKLANSVAFGGKMVELVHTTNPITYHDSLMNEVSFSRLSLGSGNRHGFASKRALISAAKSFSWFLENEKFKVPELNTIPLEQVPSAIQNLLQNNKTEKVVMVRSLD